MIELVILFFESLMAAVIFQHFLFLGSPKWFENMYSVIDGLWFFGDVKDLTYHICLFLISGVINGICIFVIFRKKIKHKIVMFILSFILTEILAYYEFAFEWWLTFRDFY